jgi:rubrerythrin
MSTTADERLVVTAPLPRTEFRCDECGYGIVVGGALPPACPMCRAESWEAVAWRPFSGGPGGALPLH